MSVHEAEDTIEDMAISLKDCDRVIAEHAMMIRELEDSAASQELELEATRNQNALQQGLLDVRCLVNGFK